MPCHCTGHDRHNIRMLATQKQLKQRKTKEKEEKKMHTNTHSRQIEELKKNNPNLVDTQP